MPWLRRRKLESLVYASPSGLCSTVPLVQAQIVARTFAEAAHAAGLMGLGRNEWRFVADHDRLRGQYRGMTVFYGDWFRRDDAVEIAHLALANEMDVWMIDDTYQRAL